MTKEGVDQWIWVLVYGGLLAICLGLFVRPGDGMLGWVLIVAGAVLTGVGATLVWVRSRMEPPPPEGKQR